MATVNCYTCDAELLTYEPGEPVPSYVIVAPSAPVPAGNHLVHICPEQPEYVAQKRPDAQLDWTDEQERAAVAAALPDWELRASDVIFCMAWYNPGMGRDVASAPLTVQVRRDGVDLKYAVQGEDFDEAGFTASEAVALLQQLEIDPWPGLTADLEAETAAADEAEDQAARQAKLDAEASRIWDRAITEAEAAAVHAQEHAEEHPDDEQLQQAAKQAKSDVEFLRETAERAKHDMAVRAGAA